MAKVKSDFHPKSCREVVFLHPYPVGKSDFFHPSRVGSLWTVADDFDSILLLLTSSINQIINFTHECSWMNTFLNSLHWLLRMIWFWYIFFKLPFFISPYITRLLTSNTCSRMNEILRGYTTGCWWLDLIQLLQQLKNQIINVTHTTVHGWIRVCTGCGWIDLTQLLLIRRGIQLD
jgi:hypothetical protein